MPAPGGSTAAKASQEAAALVTDSIVVERDDAIIDPLPRLDHLEPPCRYLSRSTTSRLGIWSTVQSTPRSASSASLRRNAALHSSGSAIALRRYLIARV